MDELLPVDLTFSPISLALVFFLQIRLNASGSVSTEQFQNMSIINGL